MAIKKIEIRPKGDGTYGDVLFPKTSADMVTTSDGSNVQAKLNNMSTSASDTPITDTGAYYTSVDVEGALQEIGQTMNSMRGSLTTSVNNLLGM